MRTATMVARALCALSVAVSLFYFLLILGDSGVSGHIQMIFGRHSGTNSPECRPNITCI